MSSSEDSKEYEIIKTGGHIDDAVSCLIKRANDKEEEVQISILQSLVTISNYQPSLVLSSLVTYVNKGKDLNQRHRVQCLKIINASLEIIIDKIDKNIAKMVAKFAANEMVMSREVKRDWQTPASSILIALSVNFPNIVLDNVLSKFNAGIVPHYFVMKTLGELAATNGVAFTLRLREVLSKVIPVLGAVKTESMKWAFIAGLGRFAEAIVYFEANANDQQHLEVDSHAFEADFSSSFDVILNKWLLSKEPKVKLAAMETLGYMASRLSVNALDNKLIILIPKYIEFLRREKAETQLSITQGLSSVINASLEKKCDTIDTHIQEILGCIHPMTARPPDYRKPSTIKNHNEILRIFETLCRSEHREVTLMFLTNRFQTKEPVSIIASLVILRHLVNALGNDLEDKKPFILSSVSSLVSESNLKIRKTMLQLIVSMANQNYLSIQGGEILVQYIAKQCAINDDVINKYEQANRNKKNTVDEVTPQQIRMAANRILHVMTTKVPTTHIVLWPYLLELLTDGNFTPAIQVLCQCIGSLLEYKNENNEEIKLNFDLLPNLPKPQAIFARLFVIACEPHKKNNYGESIINCLENLSLLIHPSLNEYFHETMPALKQHLDENKGDDLNTSKWQDTLLKVWKQSINIIRQSNIGSSGQWLRDLTDILSSQYILYDKDDSIARRAIHRYLGALLALIDERNLVNNTIKLLMSTCNHINDIERHGCAQGMGMAGSKHLDVVLQFLTSQLSATKPKKTSFFSFGPSDSEVKLANDLKSTIVLSYGYVVAYADRNLITSRIDAHVIANITPIMNSTSKLNVKENVVKSLDLIGKAVHPSRLSEESKFILKPRDDLINGILIFLGMKIVPTKKGQNIPKPHIPNNQLRVLGLNALSTLVNLDPSITPDLLKNILDAILPFYNLNGIDNDVLDLIYSNLDTLLSSIIYMDSTITCLTTLLQRFEIYMIHENINQRLHSINSYLVVLKRFISKYTNASDIEVMHHHERELTHLGHYVAILLPRVCDPNLDIRQTAVENIQALLYVDHLLHRPDDRSPTDKVREFTKFRDNLDCDTLDERLDILSNMTNILVDLIPDTELPSLLKSLISGLKDYEVESAIGAAHLLQQFFMKRGSTLSGSLDILATSMIASFESIKLNVREKALEAYQILTKQHFKLTFETMFAVELPLQSEVISAYRAIADSDMANDTLQMLIKTINDTPLLESKENNKVMVATCALGAILSLSSIGILMRKRENYAATLGTLLMRIGSAADVKRSTSLKDTVQSLRIFVESHDELLNDTLTEDIWQEIENSSTFDEGVGKFIDIICKIRNDRKMKSEMMQFLLPYLSPRSFYGQRVVVTAIFNNFVPSCGNDSDLIQILIKQLLPRVTDQRDLVRKQALIGLGNLENVWNDEVDLSASSILSALNSATGDKEYLVAKEAVAGLTRIIHVVSPQTISPVLIHICYQLRSNFDRTEAEIRVATFRLFGALCRFGALLDNSAFMDQLHENIPIVLIHLCDEDTNVQNECLITLNKMVVLLNNKFVKMLEDEWTQVTTEDYDKFVLEFVKILCEIYPQRTSVYLDWTTEYFKSDWSVLRGSSVILAGSILASSTEQARLSLHPGRSVSDISEMLKQNSAQVRSKAAKALALLYTL